jgi:hypothetical protein
MSLSSPVGDESSIVAPSEGSKVPVISIPPASSRPPREEAPDVDGVHVASCGVETIFALSPAFMALNVASHPLIVSVYELPSASSTV